MEPQRKLEEYLKQITPPNAALAEMAERREDLLAKPLKSLGRLEDLAIQLSATQNATTLRHGHKLMVVCAGDHGVTDEGVSPYPKSVTYQQILNFDKGFGAIAVLCRTAGVKVLLLDAGVDYDFPPLPGLLNRKIGKGTKNIAKGPAMTREEAVLSVLAGLEAVLAEPYVDLVAAGEMGIGNTTPSSCVSCVYAGLTPEDSTGRGSGLKPDLVRRKTEVIRRALEVNKPDPGDPLDVLAKVGGYEIGAMCGVYLGGAMRQAGVIIDGFIGAAAALLAEKLAPGVSKRMIAGHRSKEKAHAKVLEHLNLKPLLDLDMCLGEGSGAAVAMFIVECACTHFNQMRTMAEASIDEPDGSMTS
ncbi:MAG: nicotinate-nucleotide--dimethylbenzimidazole phosphoribosyltransferase [Deltaproteobacteria bacterium]|jgi:nicotinate-nucleotide--dimethylbenzimidazole phosphoribosyltransferase|nr:nicotinate-nucleotide--dimethylbenzimidazole phosphoribosyltransferase [Deltaproteobacteria bacterium]